MFQRFILLFFLLASSATQAQTYRYLILFKDKASNTYTLSKPADFLSSKSLAGIYEQTPITYGARLSGKLNQDWRIGAEICG